MTGAELITQERTRQILACGWTPEHDDAQQNGELLSCAIQVARDVWTHDAGMVPAQSDVANYWPYERARHVRKKYSVDHISRLAIAGALIAAEIDRLQREKANA